MGVRRWRYGLLGLLSLLGLIGIFSEEKGFLAFFAFAIHFEYFFIKSDEMADAYMRQSAARGFYSGMLTTAGVALAVFFLGDRTGGEALAVGMALGWAASVVVYTLSTVYYGWMETWGLERDKE